MIDDFDPTANVKEVVGHAPYIHIFGRWLRRPFHFAPEAPKPDNPQPPSQHSKKRRHASDDGKKLVEVKAEQVEVRAENSVTARPGSASGSSRDLFDRVNCAIERAERSRAAVVSTWKKLACGKKKKAVKRHQVADPPGLDLELFSHNFQNWLGDRGLEDILQRDSRNDPPESDFDPPYPLLYYKYIAPASSDNAQIQPGANWKRAYHGTWFYGLRSILHYGVLLESVDEEKGHRFHQPGLYLAPNLNTAIWFARPHVVFDDGMFHRAIVEVLYDTSREIEDRSKGSKGKQGSKGSAKIILSSDAVAISGVLIQPNSPPYGGEERFCKWDQSLEIIPRPLLQTREACERQRRRDREQCRERVLRNDSGQRERKRARESSLAARREEEAQRERDHRRREYEARRESYARRAEEAWRERDELRRQHAQREEEARRRRRSLSPPGRFNAFSPSRRRRRRRARSRSEP